MDKKELKFYEAPACEVVELKANVSLLAGSVVEEIEDAGGGAGSEGGGRED